MAPSYITRAMSWSKKVIVVGGTQFLRANWSRRWPGSRRASVQQPSCLNSISTFARMVSWWKIRSALRTKARQRHAPLRSALCLAFWRKPFKTGVHTSPRISATTSEASALCGRRLWLSITTRHVAKSAKRESPGSRFGGAGQGSHGLGPWGYHPGSARKPRPYYAPAILV